MENKGEREKYGYYVCYEHSEMKFILASGYYSCFNWKTYMYLMVEDRYIHSFNSDVFFDKKINNAFWKEIYPMAGLSEIVRYNCGQKKTLRKPSYFTLN